MKRDYQKILYELISFENDYMQEDFKLIAGIDEVGRGPLAGPCVVACVIMDRNNTIEGVYDSKKLTEKMREELFEKIEQNAIAIGVGWIENHEIDEIGIGNAVRKAVYQAIDNLDMKPQFIFCDYIPKLKFNIPHAIVTKGDMQSYSIACASIYAKVLRDRYMTEMAKKYPEYGFETNVGYGSKKHRDALVLRGSCEIHRQSFLNKILKNVEQTNE